MTDAEQPQPETISILGYESAAVDRSNPLTRMLVRKSVDVETLENEVRAFLSAMQRVIGNLDEQMGKYRMESITISAEVNAKGKLSLLGSGGEMGAKGGVNFTFKIP
jgi:hypothetical protein